MRRLISLSPLTSGWIARVGLLVLLSVGAMTTVQAQTKSPSSAPETTSYNQDVRQHTWSIYTQAGTSWTRGVWYPSIDAKRSYDISPAVGGGIDFTIQPWVRIGAEYTWSRYRREQRFAHLSAKVMPLKVYGNYLVNYHNAKVGLGLNFMELWPRRGAQWLNIWLGSGVGYSFAQGNEYAFLLNNTITQGGKTTPFTDGMVISNGSSVSFSGNVRTTNRHEDYNALYIPASLHIEADVSRQFTLGLKGQVDWFLNRKDITPKNNIFALATVRYNFVRSEASLLRERLGDLDALNAQLNELQRAVREAQDKAALAEQARQQTEQTCADLERRLKDCEDAKPAVELPGHFVQFDHNSSYMSQVEKNRLRAFAQSVRGHKLDLLAEASTPGTTGYNQQLSERRLQRVVDMLIAEGFAAEDLNPQVAVGESNGKPAATGRRVTITVRK